MLGRCSGTETYSLPRSTLSRSLLPRSSGSFSAQEAVFLLHKCKVFKQIKLVHSKIIKNGLSQDQLLVRELLQLCFSLGEMDYATLVFRQVRHPDNYTWNVMIRACTLNGRPIKAVLLYNRMICMGFPPDKFTFPFALKACSACLDVWKGREVHGLAIKTGLYNDMFVRNTLMDLYFKCGDLDSGWMVFDTTRLRTVVSWTTLVAGLVACGELDAAREAFDKMPARNVVSWTAIINGCVQQERPHKAFRLFGRMLRENVRPNEYTLVSLLKACTQLESLDMGIWIHGYSLKKGFKLGAFLGTALIDMYSKCGSLEVARQVFDKMESKTLASWNTMITSLGVHGYAEEALALFSLMELHNVRPDAISFVAVLSACVIENNLLEGLRLFKHMRDHYGIEPIEEHYACLIDLYKRADMFDAATRLENLRGYASAAGVGADPDPNVAYDRENLKDQCEKELQFLESSSSGPSNSYQLQYSSGKLVDKYYISRMLEVNPSKCLFFHSVLQFPVTLSGKCHIPLRSSYGVERNQVRSFFRR